MSSPAPAPLAAQAAAMMSERPTISSALKTFLSLKLAEGLVEEDAPAASKAALLGAVRALSKRINAYELPDAVAWGRAHPQQDDEPGAKRLEDLQTHNVCLALRATCTKQKQKPTMLLGRSYLRHMFSDAVAGMPAPSGVEQTVLDGVVSAFKTELMMDDTESVVWAPDWRKALAERQRKRVSAAQTRGADAAAAAAAAQGGDDGAAASKQSSSPSPVTELRGVMGAAVAEQRQREEATDPNKVVVEHYRGGELIGRKVQDRQEEA